MATERKNVVDRIKDLTQCCICADTLTDARVLPCLHTFCLQCLQLAGGDRRPYQRMPCPICRNEFSIPRQGFAGLQKNFLMENLLEMASLPSSVETVDDELTLPENSDNSLPCDVCSDVEHVGDAATASVTVAAVVYCVNCHQSLCRLCYNHHKRMPATRLHRFSDDSDVVGEFRREIASEVEALSTWMAEGETKKQGVLEAKTRFVEKMTKVEEDVKRLRDKAKEVVDSRAASLLQELTTSKQKHLEHFQGSLDRLEGHLAVLESFMKRCMHAKDAGTADDVVCRIAGDLKGTTDDLYHMHGSKLKEQMAETTVPIDVSQLDQFLDRRKEEKPVNKEETKRKDKAPSSRQEPPTLRSSVPSTDIDTSVASSLTMKNLVALLVLVTSIILAVLLSAFVPRVHPVSLHLAARLDKDHSVMGVTVVDDKIYVLSGSIGSVLVYQARDPFSFIDEIAIPEITSPWDIAGSSESSCLYISDKDTSCVWKVSLTEVEKDGWFGSERYEHLVSRWLCGISEPHTLSISNDGTMLLLLVGNPPRLETYDHDSTLIRSLELPLDVEDPRHALESSTGTYVISYGWSGTKTQGLVELASDGRVLRTNDPLNEWQHLKNPHHLAIDAENRVYVADFYNNRVLLLDSNLHWDQRDVLTEDKNGISKPHRLSLDRDNKHLIVAHSDGGKVDVYTLEETAQAS